MRAEGSEWMGLGGELQKAGQGLRSSTGGTGGIRQALWPKMFSLSEGEIGDRTHDAILRVSIRNMRGCNRALWHSDFARVILQSVRVPKHLAVACFRTAAGRGSRCSGGRLW